MGNKGLFPQKGERSEPRSRTAPKGATADRSPRRAAGRAARVAVPLAFFCTLFFRHRKKSVSAPWDGQSQLAPESARQAPSRGISYSKVVYCCCKPFSRAGVGESAHQWCRAIACGRTHSSKILPSVEIVTTFHGINFPLCCKAAFAARSSPPQQGTSMRTTVTLRMSFCRRISVSLSE